MNAVILLPWTVVLVLLLEPSFRPAGLAIGCSVAAMLWLVSWRRPLRIWLEPLRPWLALVAVVLAGWQVATAAQAHFAPWLLSSDTAYVVDGRIDGLPEQDRFGTRLRLTVDCVSRAENTCDLYQRSHPFWPVLVEISAPHAKWAQPPRPGQRRA